MQPNLRVGSQVAALMGTALTGLALTGAIQAQPVAPTEPVSVLDEQLHWTASPPLLGPLDRDGDHFYSIKDPSFVQVNDRWHVFATVRGQHRSHQIEYLNFADWEHTERVERHMLPITEAYFCAPQVFYFRPQQKWYLLYQDSAGSRADAPRRPAFSTNTEIGDWQHWTAPQPLYEEPGELVHNWIDFWIICDETKAHLFFTCDDGTMWRADANLADFPHGWNRPVLVIRGDVFEASHTYRVQGSHQYLTIIECIGHGRRYYKSYVADALDGAWRPVAGTWEQPFAGSMNVAQPGGHWTDSFSHGELFRASNDERMEIDPHNPRLLFQGVLDENMHGKPYGEIPWWLGILTPSRSASD